MRLISSILPERFKVLSTIDLRNDGCSSTSLPFPVSARFPSTRAIPSTFRASEGPSIVPLTCEDQPLLSQLRRSFLEPTGLTNDSSLNLALRGLSLSESSSHYNVLGICYRFLPDHTSFIKHGFVITNKMRERLSHICNTIGLRSNSIPYYVPELFSYSRLGRGVRGLVNENYDKIVVEMLTFYKGKYARLILLVSMGVSCTVWYMLVPGVGDVAPSLDLFPRLDSYQRFYNPETYNPLFQKLCFIERTYITDDVLKTLENEYPFTEMSIPASGNTRIAVGLGLIIGVFLAMGIVPLNDSVPVSVL